MTHYRLPTAHAHEAAQADSRFTRREHDILICNHSRIPAENLPVVELLERLRQAAPEYPADLLAARRAAFLARIAAADPDDVDTPTDGVSDWQDERNSREFPY